MLAIAPVASVALLNSSSGVAGLNATPTTVASQQLVGDQISSSHTTSTTPKVKTTPKVVTPTTARKVVTPTTLKHPAVAVKVAPKTVVTVHHVAAKPKVVTKTPVTVKKTPVKKPVATKPKDTTTTTSTTTTLPGSTTTTSPGATTTTTIATTTTTKPKPKPKPKPAVKYRIGIATWYSYVPGRCATSYLPHGTRIVVRVLHSSREISCLVTDTQGSATGRVVDLSETQFAELAPLWRGVVRVIVVW